MSEHTHAEHEHHHDAPHGDETPVEFWEKMYAAAEAGSVWSGRVNHAIETYAATLRPGTSLDLGCGEGGDVLWLAEHGWSATGIDLSRVAIARAQRAAEERCLESARFVAADLADWVHDAAAVDGAEAPFDLVTASFLQSPVDLPRAAILRAAASRVAVGGHLLLVSHAAPPKGFDHPGEFPSPSDELAMLGFDGANWETVVAEVISRTSTRPERGPTMDDTVVFVRRVR